MAFTNSNTISIDGSDNSPLTEFGTEEIDALNSDSDTTELSQFSILSATPATKKKRTRAQTASELWSYARPPLPEEDHRNNHGHRLFYCSRCNYSGAALNRVEEHLRKHGIKLTARPSLKKQAIDGSLAGIFKKQDERQAKRNIEEEKILKSVVNKKAFNEALAQLITVRALPHSILEWPEFYTLLYSINYMCLDSVVRSRAAIPLLLKDTFFLHRTKITDKLHRALTDIHFAVDIWSSGSHTTLLAVTAHFVDGDTGKLAMALLALRELHGGHGGRIWQRLCW